MVKSIIGTSLLAGLLLLSGCGDSDGKSRLSSQQMLDKGDFSSLATSLEAKDNKSNEEYLMLGSAYMGLAGLSFTDLVTMVADSDVTTLNAPSYRGGNGSSDAFSQFAKKIQENADSNPKVLEYLQKAIDNYQFVSEAMKKIAHDNNITYETSDVELFMGLAFTAKATTAFSYLGDLEALVSDSVANGVSDELRAYGCAISHVYAGVKDPKCTLVGITGPYEIKGNTYKEIEMVVNGQSYKKLTNLTEDEVILTKDQCYADGSTTNSMSTRSYACPVGDGNLTIQSVLVDTINEGFETIISLAPDDVQNDIRKFKDEIGTDSSGNITAQSIADYISTTIKK